MEQECPADNDGREDYSRSDHHSAALSSSQASPSAASSALSLLLSRDYAELAKLMSDLDQLTGTFCEKMENLTQQSEAIPTASVYYTELSVVWEEQAEALEHQQNNSAAEEDRKAPLPGKATKTPSEASVY
jgi:hypothetical protein